MPGHCHFRVRGLLLIVISLVLTTFFYSYVSDPRPLSDLAAEASHQLQIKVRLLNNHNGYGHSLRIPPAKDSILKEESSAEDYSHGHSNEPGRFLSNIAYRSSGILGASADSSKVKRQLDETELLSKYLRLLGFTEQPSLFNNDRHEYDSNSQVVNHGMRSNSSVSNSLDRYHYSVGNQTASRNSTLSDRLEALKKELSSLVIVTTVVADQLPLAVGFIKSINDNFPYTDLKLVIYDLGLYRADRKLLSSICNGSLSSATPLAYAAYPTCEFRRFNYSLYPSHVSDLSTGAYRPLIIQETLNRRPYSLLWTDVHYYLETSQLSDIGLVIRALTIFERGKRVGLQAWSVQDPTTTLTHPKMFDYFRVPRDNFFFHRMIKLDQILLYNTGTIHKEFMLPWVKCALKSDCIAPIGAQFTASACRFDKKPFFRYSGCHLYDISAANIILGKLFAWQTTTYEASIPSSYLFRRVFYDRDTESIGTADTEPVSPLNILSISSTPASVTRHYQVVDLSASSSGALDADSEFDDVDRTRDMIDDLISAFIARRVDTGGESLAPSVPFHNGARWADILSQKHVTSSSSTEDGLTPLPMIRGSPSYKHYSSVSRKFTHGRTSGPTVSRHPSSKSMAEASYSSLSLHHKIAPNTRTVSDSIDVYDMDAAGLDSANFIDSGMGQMLKISRYKVFVNGTQIEKLSI